MTTRKRSTMIWEVSVVVDCQTKIVMCDYAAKEDFEVTITVLPIAGDNAGCF